MFAMSKAFAIAESIINIQLALSEASKLPYPTNLSQYAIVAAQTASIVSTIQSVQMSGFAEGGYTGHGGKYTPAGIVHRGEYVITKEATARLGLDYLNFLNYGKRGFANGGGVGIPKVPSVYTPSRPKGTSHHITLKQHYTIDARGADHGVEQRISELLKQNKRETIAEIRNQIRRGGQFGKDFGVA